MSEMFSFFNRHPNVSNEKERLEYTPVSTDYSFGRHNVTVYL